VPIDLAALREWIGIPATIVDDPALQQVVDAELVIQATKCRLPTDETGAPLPLPPDLVQALYRRVAREIAARDLPLGMLGAETDFGPARLSRFDAEIERLEGSRRIMVVG
jgi:hypothetical protein